jgi:hypothetical protein
MIHTLVESGSKLLQWNGAGPVTRGVTAVRRRLPITRAPTRAPGAVHTRVDHGAERAPTTLQVVPQQAPRRR